jgi:hypothetical protein
MRVDEAEAMRKENARLIGELNRLRQMLGDGHSPAEAERNACELLCMDVARELSGVLDRDGAYAALDCAERISQRQHLSYPPG